jgi:hypothetical protein
MSPAEELTPLYVRLDKEDADRLERAAFESRTSKRALVTGALRQHLGASGSPAGSEVPAGAGSPAAPGSPSAPGAPATPSAPGAPTASRVDVNWPAQSFDVGRHEFRPLGAALPEVLTLEQAADFLQVSPSALSELADAGELPGRQIAGEWRFAREGLVAWLGAG